MLLGNRKCILFIFVSLCLAHTRTQYMFAECMNKWLIFPILAEIDFFEGKAKNSPVCYIYIYNWGCTLGKHHQDKVIAECNKVQAFRPYRENERCVALVWITILAQRKDTEDGSNILLKIEIVTNVGPACCLSTIPLKWTK